MNRKQRRSLGKQLGEEATSTVDLMLNLPSECLTCKKSYDKMSKEMAMTWYIEVYKKDKIIKLYCPECQEKRKNELSK